MTRSISHSIAKGICAIGGHDEDPSIMDANIMSALVIEGQLIMDDYIIMDKKSEAWKKLFLPTKERDDNG